MKMLAKIMRRWFGHKGTKIKVSKVFVGPAGEKATEPIEVRDGKVYVDWGHVLRETPYPNAPPRAQRVK